MHQACCEAASILVMLALTDAHCLALQAAVITACHSNLCTPARWQMPALSRWPRAENLSRLLSAAAAATSSKMPIAVA